MSKSICNCPDCGEALFLEVKVTVPDDEPNNSKLLFGCDRCGKYVFEIKPDSPGNTFRERQDFMLDQARKHLINDRVIRVRQRIIVKARRAAIEAGTSA
jgi:predicted  nucleic acid-binding Zn-ribbon protein